MKFPSTAEDGRTDVVTKRFLLCIFYVKKSSQQSKKHPTSTVQTYGINLNYDFNSSINMQIRFIPRSIFKNYKSKEMLGWLDFGGS